MSQNLHIHTVSEITAYIKGTLEEDLRLQDILVRGEISNYRIPGKHLYFSLKDSGGILSCIMFEDKFQNLKFDLRNGLEVVARGNIGVYPPQGRYQLYVEELFPLGKGLLYLNYEKLKEELQKKGYFDPEHKVPLPFLPQRIGVVTSSRGAAIKDILKVLQDRFPNLEIVISPCKVQGEGAAEEIARAIENLNEYGNIDVIIVGRGGGSFEDLFAFNEKMVADAIYNSRIPIISAVGHEIDLTIADLVADEKAPTPSAAAERVIPRKEELILKLREKRRKLTTLVNQKSNALKQEIVKLRKLLEVRHPRIIIQELKQRMDDYRRRIRDDVMSNVQSSRNDFLRIAHQFIQYSPYHQFNLMRQKVKTLKEKIIKSIWRNTENRKSQLFYMKNRAQGLSPYSILKRGYSICLAHPEQKIITDSARVKKGDRVKIKLYKGHLYGEIYKTQEGESEV